MSTRAYGFKDWDPMKDDYNDSLYDAQYADENTESGVQLDHSKLYITNIPQTLNEEGLKLVFTKYGSVIKLYMSRDPKKRYALVIYESPSEAKLAMIKLNRAEPLKLNVSIAHKKNNQSDDYKDRSARPSASYSRPSFTKDKEDTSSISSKVVYNQNRNMMDNDEDYDDDDGSLTLDAELHLELTHLKLEELALQKQELKYRQQLLMLNKAGGKKQHNPLASRVITSDGKIVLKAAPDRSEPAVDTTYSGAGDSLKVPELQRYRKRCLACGERGEYYCAGCGVAPYCSPQCQRQDWVARHKSVCHNLSRLSEGLEINTQNKQDNSVVADTSFRPRKHLRPKYQDNGETSSEPSEGMDKHYCEKKTKSSANRRNFSPKNANLRRPNVLDVKVDKDSGNIKAESTKSNEIAQTKIGDERQLDKKESLVDSANERSGNENPGLRPPVGTTNRNEVTRPAVMYRKKEIIGEKTEPPTISAPRSTVASNERSTIRPTKEVQQEKVPIPASIPTIEILPKLSIVSTFSIGDNLLLSVDAEAENCHTKQKGFICLAVNHASEEKYSLLCGDYCAECKANDKAFVPKPGDLFSYNNPEDEDSWYRARCLNSTTAALIDACQIAKFTEGVCRKVPAKYQDIPEFCCVLDAGNIEVGDNLSATIIAKESCESARVDLQKAETGVKVGQGTITRWSPDIELPLPAVATRSAFAIPQVLRPPLINNSLVVLVEAVHLDAIYVRPADREATRRYNEALQEAIMCCHGGTPLKEPPASGQMVIAKFTDGNHYRALVTRTNVRQNVYLLEYVDFGNVDTNTLQNMYPCPDQLSIECQPTVVSKVKIVSEHPTLSEPAKQYIEWIRDGEVEMVLTLPDGAKTAPSGSEAVLTLEKNKENFNKKVVEMCTPGWKLIEKSGTDVVELQPVMFNDMKFVGIPSSRCELVVLDVSGLEIGMLGGYPKEEASAPYILEQLPDQLAEYCNSDLGREPYLPVVDEMCIVQCPPDESWYRAVLCEQKMGAGGTEAQVYYIDYGNLATVPVKILRKMLPDFVKGVPALASHVQIRGFPAKPTVDQLKRAIAYLNLDEQCRGLLSITNCKKTDNADYEADAPGLLAAMGV